jgi:hypothetical protein
MKKRNPAIFLAIALVSLLLSALATYLSNQILSQIFNIAGWLAAIYYLYLFCTFQEGLKKETGEGKGAWGHFWTIFLTLGIYLIYWYFAAGKRLKKMSAKDRSVIYFALNFISIVIVIVYFSVLLEQYPNYEDNTVWEIVNLINGLIPYLLLAHMQYAANKTVETQVTKNQSPVKT